MNASPRTDLERRIANLEKIFQVNRALRSTFDLPSLLQVILQSIVDLVPCERSSILLIDPDTQELYFVAAGDTDFELLRKISVPRDGSIAGAVATTRQPITVHNAQTDPRFFSGVDHVTGQSTHSLIGVPMEIGGRVIGVLEAVNKVDGQPFDQEDTETLLMFASQAAAAIENTRLIQEQRQRLTESLLIQEVLLTLSRFLDLDQLLGQLLVLLEEFLGYSNGAILMYDKEHDHLRVAAVNGFDQTDLGANAIVPINQATVCGRVALTKTSLYVTHGIDVLDDEEGQPAPLLTGSRSSLAVPMVCGIDVDFVGVLSLESQEPGAFGEHDARILTTIATQAAIGIRQAELYGNSIRANRLKQEFIATMSHELRTPMTVLIGYSEMLLSGALGDLEQRQAEAIGVIRHRANLLLRLLNDVLDYSKIVAGELKLYPAVLNLSQAIRLALEKYRPEAERKQQRLSMDVDAGCQYALADDQRLHQVLGHLIENAIKFSQDGRPILVRARHHSDEFIRIDVVDQGIGIEPQDMDVIFEDFRQLDSSFTRQYGGTGIGLAIAKHLVELQGGMIWVDSEPGKGSTFSFILPRPPEREQSGSPPRPTGSGES
jgi:signal transduction histidine kinase